MPRSSTRKRERERGGKGKRDSLVFFPRGRHAQIRLPPLSSLPQLPFSSLSFSFSFSSYTHIDRKREDAQCSLPHFLKRQRASERMEAARAMMNASTTTTAAPGLAANAAALAASVDDSPAPLLHHQQQQPFSHHHHHGGHHHVTPRTAFPRMPYFDSPAGFPGVVVAGNVAVSLAAAPASAGAAGAAAKQQSHHHFVSPPAADNTTTNTASSTSSSSSCIAKICTWKFEMFANICRRYENSLWKC